MSATCLDEGAGNVCNLFSVCMKLKTNEDCHKYLLLEDVCRHNPWMTEFHQHMAAAGRDSSLFIFLVDNLLSCLLPCLHDQLNATTNVSLALTSLITTIVAWLAKEG